MPTLTRVVQDQIAVITEILTRVRPISVIRKLQLVFVLVTLAMVTFFLSSPFLGGEKIDIGPDKGYEVGKTAPETVLSWREITYEDARKTQAERSRVYNSGVAIFERDYSMLTNTVNSFIDIEIENLKSVVNDQSSKNIYQLIAKNPRWKNRSKEDLELLLNYPKKDRLKELIKQCTNLVFTTNCILKESPPDMQGIVNNGGKIINKGVKEQNSFLDGKHIFQRENLYHNSITMNMVTSLIESKFPKLDSSTLSVVKRLSISYIYSFPACSYNAEETEQVKLEEQARVKPIISKIEKNERIVRKGEIITPEILNKLEQMNLQASRINLSSIVSIIIVQMVFLIIITVFLKKYNPKRLNDLASNIIIFSMIWIFMISTYILSRLYYHPDNSYNLIYFFAIFTPIGMVCLLIGFLFDEELAIAIGFYLSFFIFLISQTNVSSFVMAFATTVVASMYSSKIRRRIDFLKSGFLITGIQIVIATSGYLIEGRDFFLPSNEKISFLRELSSSPIFKLYLACLVNGFVCATGAQFLLPIYEYLFNIPTRFKLQELADTGHPLMQALLTKAPSTYTHTFLVAALSERAAQNLGLDWLLVRAGVYFHDIGKIPNASFFVENQHLIPKKEHIDKNNPGLAAKIVIDHVIDGIEMAKKARLPREIISFIPEHHGTSTMAFFYHKALADLSPNQRKKINKKDFQYPGPKPQRKETGIVMIADSVEAASRSLDEITSESLDELIQKIINIKLAENQLDESGLTVGDLNIIKHSFKEILLSSLHNRPKYPNTEDTKKLEAEKTNQTKLNSKTLSKKTKNVKK
ncbi:MAG: HDIG domain-containing protein [Leptospiraceae bacterium]|nr:HDIG domain-containing protein [Leptospiraceae bacterium]